MFIRVIYDAKIGKHRCMREGYMNSDAKDELHLQFDRDIDWSQPVFMILISEDEHIKMEADPVEFGEVPLDKREEGEK